MAESLDDGEFWLPAQFLTDKDILMDKGNINNSRNKGGITTGIGFTSYGYDLFGPSSDLSSPVESVNGSTETESDEEDYLAGLTRQIAHAALQDEFVKVDHGFVYENKKTWGMAGSPQSTLCAVGGGCGCKQGSNRGSPISPSQVSSPPATWDLLYAAAGEVAKIRMNDEEYGYQQSRGLLAPPRKPSPISVPVKNANTDAGFYSNHSVSHQQFQATQFQHLKQQQMMKQRQQAVWGGQQQKGTGLYQPQQVIQNRGKSNEVGINRSNRPLGLSLSAWPPLQAQQQQQQPQQGGSGMRVVFLGTHGSRKECAGTGVFLPRRVGNPPEMRKKSGCSTALLPARVVQALNLKLDDVGSQTQLHPRFNGSFAPDVDAAVKLRSSYGFACEQRRAFRAQPVMNHEIRLPQEWTY